MASEFRESGGVVVSVPSTAVHLVDRGPGQRGVAKGVVLDDSAVQRCASGGAGYSAHAYMLDKWLALG